MTQEEQLRVALCVLRDIAANLDRTRYTGQKAFDLGYRMGLSHQAEIADLALMRLKDPVDLLYDEDGYPTDDGDSGLRNPKT